MKYVRCFLFVAVSVTLTFSAWTDVSGVVESNGDPVSGAKVEVVSTGFIAVTDDDGQFAIDTAYASVEYNLGSRSLNGNIYEIDRRYLTLNAFKNTNYTLYIYNTKGRTIFKRAYRDMNKLYLYDIIKTSGVYFLRAESIF